MPRAAIPQRFDVPRTNQLIFAQQRDVAGAIEQTLTIADLSSSTTVIVIDNGDGTASFDAAGPSRAEMDFR